MLVIYWHGKAVSSNKRLKWTKSRMVPNSDYQAFIDSLAWQLKLHGEKITGYVDVKLEVDLPKSMDSDAVEKPCLDAIQRSGIITNDNMIRNINVVRKYHKRNEIDRIGFFIEEVKEEV